jgi:amino acid transporter
MARAEVLPNWLASIHPTHHTPHHAVIAQGALALLIGLVVGSLVAPDQSFFMLGTLGTIIYVFVYLMGNIGVARFFLTRARQELNVLIHIIFPIVSTIALLLVLYYSLVPLPAPPVSYAPLIGLVLFLAGLAVLWKLHSRRDSRWKTLSQYVLDADATTPVDPRKLAAPISAR